jgi:hypothetical protein
MANLYIEIINDLIQEHSARASTHTSFTSIVYPLGQLGSRKHFGFMIRTINAIDINNAFPGITIESNNPIKINQIAITFWQDATKTTTQTYGDGATTGFLMMGYAPLFPHAPEDGILLNDPSQFYNGIYFISFPSIELGNGELKQREKFLNYWLQPRQAVNGDGFYLFFSNTANTFANIQIYGEIVI